MGRIGKRATAALVLMTATLLIACSSCIGDKPRRDLNTPLTFTFTVSTSALEPWEVLYVTADGLSEPLRLIESTGSYYAEAVIETELGAYLYIVGDEWGNTYRGERRDAAGERTLPEGKRDAVDLVASFEGELKGLPQTEVNVTVKADLSESPDIFMLAEPTGNRQLLQENEAGLYCTLKLPVGRHDLSLYTAGADGEIDLSYGHIGDYTITVTRRHTQFVLEAELTTVPEVVKLTVRLKTPLAAGRSLWFTAVDKTLFIKMRAISPLLYEAEFETLGNRGAKVNVYYSETENKEDIVFVALAAKKLSLTESDVLAIEIADVPD